MYSRGRSGGRRSTMARLAAAEATATDGLASRFVRTHGMPWEKTRFPGIETKTLLFNPGERLITLLLRMAPGAILPDHEHVLIEQSYVIEGRLVDKEGPEAGSEA